MINSIDWPTIGIGVLGFLGTGLGVVSWLKKNIANVQQLRKDGADLTVQTKYFKAMLKDNAALKTEMSNQKIQINELKKYIKELTEVVKEASKNGLSE